MKYCVKCVTPSTRPRVTFDKNGVCNACQWHEKKMTEIDWADRWEKLKRICAGHRNKDFDVIVPCSGGKDGSVVAWKLKHELDMHPLCVTFSPQIQTRLGRQNLENFRQSGFDHILITPDVNAYRKYSKKAFIERGMPKQPFVVGISTSVIRTAIEKGIGLIMWGEQGELEYGGDDNFVERFNYDFLKNIYYEGEDPSRYGYWWQMPSENDLNDIYSTWWSLYEDWDPDEHARFAKQKCGLELMVGGSIGTFTNASQLDDVMQDLHTYLQFVKFGFGRCTSDASIEIRRGRMSREQGIEVVKKLDGQFPLEYLPVYLDYFEMTEKEFWAVIDRFVDYKILDKMDKPERPYILKCV